MVYNQLGLQPIVGALSLETGEQYRQMRDLGGKDDTGKGSVLFFRTKANATDPDNPAHVAIRDGETRININSNTMVHRMREEDTDASQMRVERENLRDGVGNNMPGKDVDGKSFFTEGYYSDIKSKTIVDLDAD